MLSASLSLAKKHKPIGHILVLRPTVRICLRDECLCVARIAYVMHEFGFRLRCTCIVWFIVMARLIQERYRLHVWQADRSEIIVMSRDADEALEEGVLLLLDVCLQCSTYAAVDV